MSHDWPRGIEQSGSVKYLLRRKPFFRKEIQRNDLGSPLNEAILRILQPRNWFSAHLHVKFTANVIHDDASSSIKDDSPQLATKFLALDKCLPKRQYLEIIDVEAEPVPDQESQGQSTGELEFDKHWLAVLSSY